MKTVPVEYDWVPTGRNVRVTESHKCRNDKQNIKQPQSNCFMNKERRELHRSEEEAGEIG